MAIRTFLLITLLHFLAIYFIYSKLDFEFSIVGFAIYLLTIISHFFTAIMNPGIPGRDILYFEDVPKRRGISDEQLIAFDEFDCNKCNISSRFGFSMKHCDICNVCILEKSNHSKWFGKCIGKKNQQMFDFFVNIFWFGTIYILVTLGFLVFNL